MGRYDVTFGVWMKANPLHGSKMVTYNACTNKKCENYKHHLNETIKFCPKCGYEVKERELKVPMNTYLSDVVYPDEGDAPKYFENLNTWGDDSDVLTDGGFRKQVNMEGKTYQPWAKDGDGDKAIINPQAEIDKFKKRYSKAINDLEKLGFVLSFEWGPFVTYD